MDKVDLDYTVLSVLGDMFCQTEMTIDQVPEVGEKKMSESTSYKAGGMVN